jgi:chromosome segregation ATPase
MEQNKSRVIIDASLQESNNQKKKTLEITSQKIAAEKEQTRLKSEFGDTNNKLSEAQSQLANFKSQAQLEAAKKDKLIAEAKKKETELIIQLETQIKQLAKSQSDFNATNSELTEKLIAAKGQKDEKLAKLDDASQLLKAFLSTGLTPEEILKLKQRRPIEMPVPNFILPQAIRPGKLTAPIQLKPKSP